jgi:hypothetical protein
MRSCKEHLTAFKNRGETSAGGEKERIAGKEQRNGRDPCERHVTTALMITIACGV